MSSLTQQNISREEAGREVENLSRLLRRYQHSYYIEGRPEVSDQEYDRLFDRLTSLESLYPELQMPDSPTLRVGSDLVSELPEVEHTIPVLSLDKAYSVDDVARWVLRTSSPEGSSLSFVIEEKIDGLSIVLYYEEGLLIRAVTRGNGFKGNDVTANVKTIASVPLRLTEPVTIAVRGEIYLPRDRFEEINARQETPYANPRNLAAGTLRRIRSSDVARVPLSIFIYEGFFPAEETASPATHKEVLSRLKQLGFRINDHYLFFENNQMPDLKEFIRNENTARPGLNYEIDGLVIKVNELEPRESLGYTGHHPRWAIAYKFESPQGETTLRSIDVQVGRTGRITPVARVDAVLIGGSTISNVTLHNQDYIDMLEVSPGDRVAVAKRGDVIPAVEEVLEKNNQGNPVWKMPDECPSCQSPLIREGAHHFCRNPECPEQKRGRLRFFVGAGGMDIPSLGPETVDYLLQEGFISGIADLYRFPWEELEGEPGFGARKVQLIREGVESSRRQPFQVVLTALGIPEIGPRTARLLIRSGFSSIDRLIQAAAEKDMAAFCAVDGIAGKTASLLIEELHQPPLLALVRDLREAGLNLEDTAAAEPDDSVPTLFAGEKWCLTGSFENFKPREKAGELIEKYGGVVVSGITGKTTHLLAGEGAGSKLTKARDRGVVVVTEQEFLARLPGEAE